jgi:hypothetical protein
VLGQHPQHTVVRLTTYVGGIEDVTQHSDLKAFNEVIGRATQTTQDGGFARLGLHQSTVWFFV